MRISVTLSESHEVELDEILRWCISLQPISLLCRQKVFQSTWSTRACSVQINSCVLGDHESMEHSGLSCVRLEGVADNGGDGLLSLRSCLVPSFFWAVSISAYLLLRRSTFKHFVDVMSYPLLKYYILMGSPLRVHSRIECCLFSTQRRSILASCTSMFVFLNRLYSSPCYTSKWNITVIQRVREPT